MTDQTPAETVDERSSESLVEHIVEGIVDGVMAGRFAQGQRLIAADIAEQFNVSRAPVREALHMLAGEGVVELTPNRGARIRRLNVADRVDFLEFTESILVLGVRLATVRMHEPEHAATLEAAFSEIDKAWHIRNPVHFVKSLYQYHIQVNRIAGNRFLDFFYSRPYIRFYSLLLADMAPGDNWDRFIDNYRQIHECILGGDADTAVVTFSAHIRWVLRYMKKSDAAEKPPTKRKRRKSAGEIMAADGPAE
jgi:DNA-binding GntR family transcriptional regulator